MIYSITDDSGLLGLVDSGSYASFVNGEWKLDELLRHFLEQMKSRALLVWGSGRENMYTIETRTGFTDAAGGRTVAGSIAVTCGALHLVNYESLTMAAQFPDVVLPEGHMKHLAIPLDNGVYNCRILDLAGHPGDADDANRFILEFEKTDTPAPPWKAIPWFKA